MLKPVQIRNQVIDLLLVKHLSQGRHVSSAIYDQRVQSFVIGWSPAGEIWLLHHPLEAGTVHGLCSVAAMTARACRLEQALPVRLGGSQLG